MVGSKALSALLVFAGLACAAPSSIQSRKNQDYSKYYDVQGHRGGRGQAVENTLASFAWGLISGATTLELDVWF
jgi:glycerophosphoryl diester phosphodiesterase